MKLTSKRLNTVRTVGRQTHNNNILFSSIIDYINVSCVGEMTIENQKDRVFFCWLNVIYEVFESLRENFTLNPTRRVAIINRARRCAIHVSCFS